MLTRLITAPSRAISALHWRYGCSPQTGMFGFCEPDQPTLARFGLGQHPTCRWCKRETR